MNLEEQPHPILTEAEGMALAKKETPRAFKRWRIKFGVEALGGKKRYSRREILLALHREAGDIPMPRSLQKKAS